MSSVIIAAHNEEAVLGACLDALLNGEDAESLQVIVSANGCTDATVAIARGRGVEVVDRAEAGKAGALNAGDALATRPSRVYLDADIRVPPGGVAALMARLERLPLALAVVPRRHLNTEGRPWPVKAYVSINERLPAFRTGLFGRGMIALSGEGRGRFHEFPTLIADDLFLDSQFLDSEKAEVSDVVVVVEAPFTTRELVRRLIRVRRGNAQMRSSAAAGEIDVTVRKADRWAWWREVVMPEPRLVFAAVPYVLITLCAAVLARRPAVSQDWGRDESTRQGSGEQLGGTRS